MEDIPFDHFLNVELRTGRVTRAEPNEAAHKPAYKIWVDFGSDLGVKQTSAQVTHHYTPESLVGMSVLGCLNLGTKRIAGFKSEFLLVGFSDKDENIVLAVPDPQANNGSPVPNGSKLH